MGREGQEPRVVQRLSSFPAINHRLHVVVQTRSRYTLEMLERPDVLAQERLEILSLGEAQVLAPGIAQQVAEKIDLASPFRREVDRVLCPVHLGLDSGARLETLNRLRHS